VPELVADVEQIAAVIPRQHLPFGVEVGDLGDVGAQPHLCAGVIRIDLERAEQLAERQLLLVGHRLLRKDQDAVAIECCVDLSKELGHYWVGQIDAAYLGAESGMKRGDADHHVAPLP
jgi:hypothetical protein